MTSRLAKLHKVDPSDPKPWKVKTPYFQYAFTERRKAFSFGRKLRDRGLRVTVIHGTFRRPIGKRPGS